jgi:hypothetical protein
MANFRVERMLQVLLKRPSSHPSQRLGVIHVKRDTPRESHIFFIHFKISYKIILEVKTLFESMLVLQKVLFSIPLTVHIKLGLKISYNKEILPAHLIFVYI